MEVKIGTFLIAVFLIVGELNCQPVNDNDDNLLINKNRDITLPNNNNKYNNTSDSDSDNSSSSSNSSSNESSDLIISKSGKNNKKTDVPLVFPEDTKNYKILPSNVTIIKKLLHQNGESSEIAELNKPPPTETIVPIKKPTSDDKINENKKDYKPLDPKLLTGRNLKLKPSSSTTKPLTKQGDFYEDDYSSSGEEVENYKDEVETIQQKHTRKPKVELEEQFERKDYTKSQLQLPVDTQDIDNPIRTIKSDDSTSSGSLLFVAIVLAAAFLCTTIYLGVFVWRRKLEIRYGMRERLVTSDDDVLQDDVHYRNQPHFGQSVTVREDC